MTAKRPWILTVALVASIAAAAAGCDTVSPAEPTFELDPMAPMDTSGFIPRGLPTIP